MNAGLRSHPFLKEGSEEVWDWMLLVVEELAPVAQVLDEFPVTVDVGVQMAKPLPRMRDTLGLDVARVEFPHLGVEQVVEEE